MISWYLSFSVWLHLSMIISRTIRVAANGITSFFFFIHFLFLWLSNIPLCVYIYIFVCVCVCVRVCVCIFWLRLTFESIDWVKQIGLPNVGGPHPISWWYKKRTKRWRKGVFASSTWVQTLVFSLASNWDCSIGSLIVSPSSDW